MLAALLAMVPPKFAPAAGVQRSLHAMDQGAAVRVLFYGQSITAQDWTKTVEEELRARYPKARLTVENRAIGGFAADKLSQTLRADVLEFWPDLVIFHDYGGPEQYDPMIAWMRTRTSAEVLIASDHVTWSPDLQKPNAPPPTSEAWHDRREGELRALAQRYRCGFADVRTQWRAELARSGLPASAYLTDGVHLNDRGNALMAQIVSGALRFDSRARPAPAYRDHHGVELQAVAVRVQARGKRPFRPLVDGRPPSGHPECWAVLPSTGYGRIPLLKTAEIGPDPVAEEWRIDLSEVRDKEPFAFRVTGSKTGSDGEGRSDAPFVSKSGRLRIAPEAWEGPYLAWLLGPTWKDGFMVTAKTVLFGKDEIPGDGKWHDVGRGLDPERHRLTANVPVEWRVWAPGVAP